MGFSKNIAQKKVDSNASLPKEKRETSNKQPNFIPKASGKNKTKQKKNSKFTRRKELIKIRAE